MVYSDGDGVLDSTFNGGGLAPGIGDLPGGDRDGKRYL
jgi:hypothetical protein